MRMNRLIALGTLCGVLLPLGYRVQADTLQTRTGTYNGQVMRVEGGSVFIKMPQGEFAVPIRDLVRLDVPPPAAYEKGIAALKSGNTKEAITLLKPLADRFAGLPIAWAMDSLMQLGEAYLEQKDVSAAQAAFDTLKKFYPNTPQAQAVDVKNARVLYALQKFDDAIKAIKVYLDPQLKKDFLPADQEVPVSEALVLMGDCLAAKGQLNEAMDNYLKVVTLYDYDDARKAEALFKAAQTLEKLGNWRRAKDCYSDLLADAPDSPYAAEAKKQLDAITKAHPE